MIRGFMGDERQDSIDKPVESSAGDSLPGADPMAPPQTPCECYCLHCGRVFMSDQMWLQRVKGARDGFEGFWMCPTPNCGGAGFAFDIFPTDPDHPANEGWVEFDDDDVSSDEEEWEEKWKPVEHEAEYDPAEPHYQALDELEDEEDDIEGEEWKYGLEPGERPPAQPPPEGCEPRAPDEEEALYNAPDRRPREIDWSDRDEGQMLNDEEIPF